MPLFFSTSIVRQIVAIALFLLAISTAAIVGVTYYNLGTYVMESAVSDAKDASRSMAVLYGASDADVRVDVMNNALAGVTEDKIPAFGDYSLVASNGTLSAPATQFSVTTTGTLTVPDVTAS